MTKKGVDELAGAILGRVPMKRLGQGEDVANAVVFLASSQAYITGVELNVDDGAGQV